ncbi:tetratricopeptide repeat protein [Lysobacter fragariae]
MFVVRNLLLVAMLAVAGTANAQSLAKPGEFYFDADASALKPLVVMSETGDAAMQKLMKKIERDPHARAEQLQLAHLAMQGGQVEAGRTLYQRALSRLDKSSSVWRPGTWNYAWDLYRAGDAAGALQQWGTLQASRGVNGSWMPPTFALTLWTLGRKDEAVQWYAAAVRTEPNLWRTSARYADLLPDWSDSERAKLGEVLEAWAANPPPWP